MSKFIISCAICAALLGLGGSAHAQGTAYETFAVKNTTANEITYEVRWDNNVWKTFVLNPGQTRWHFNAVRGQGQFPEARLRYQTVNNVGNPIVVSHVMGTLLVDQPKRVTPSMFRTSDSGRLYLQILRPTLRRMPDELRIDE